MVLPQHDGTAEEWFTQRAIPRSQLRDRGLHDAEPAAATQLFYHDHVMGVTRLGLYAGEVGAAYMIRDPRAPRSTGRARRLPKGQFEILLGLCATRLLHRRQPALPAGPHGSTGGTAATRRPGRAGQHRRTGPTMKGSDVNVVNGKVWPNLNVQPQQYRFRMLGGKNAQLSTSSSRGRLERQPEPRRQQQPAALGRRTARPATPLAPFTIIGSDGGYLPAPQR